MVPTELILKFIARFKEFDVHGEVTNTFKFGCCYWFAVILKMRFSEYNAKLMYDEIENHFCTQIDNALYDISGDVTNIYNCKPWDEFDDLTHKYRIIKDSCEF